MQRNVVSGHNQVGVYDSFGTEAGVQETARGSPLEHQEWIRNRVLQLHEQRVSIQAQVFELAKRRLERQTETLWQQR